MPSKVKVFWVFIMTVLLILTSTGAFADSEKDIKKPSAFNSLMDAFIVRPIGLLMIPVGMGAFVISLPFSATGPGDSVSESYDNLVVAPVNYTFKRPLGDLW